jgi:hypothetical protein
VDVRELLPSFQNLMIREATNLGTILFVCGPAWFLACRAGT